MTFDFSSQFYDSIYSQKNYRSEVDLIKKILSENGIKAANILDVGCGTGNHSIILSEDKKLNILGVDQSYKMIKKAEQKSSQIDNLHFVRRDMLSINDLDMKFDVIIALFHVLNYLRDNSELRKFFSIVRSMLKEEGIFIFDTWNGNLCTKDRFRETTISFQHENENWKRISHPELHRSNQKVKIDFEFQKSFITQFRETHTLSYWTIEQIVELSLPHFSETHQYESIEGDRFIADLHWSPLFVMKPKKTTDKLEPVL